MKRFYSHLDYPGRGTMSYLLSAEYGLTEVFDPNEADVIVWNGGEDIATSIYLEQPISRNIPSTTSGRDIDEIALFNDYKRDPTKLLLGICRGAQLLNCLNGGKLYQDVDGHDRSHDMLDLRSGEILKVTSTHHQQMIAAPQARLATSGESVGGEIIGVSSCSRYKNHEAGVEHPVPSKDLRHGADVEIMWYPHTRSLCIQGHPEYVPGSRFAAYTLELMKEFYSSKRMAA